MNLKQISPLILKDLQETLEYSWDPTTKCAAVIYDGDRKISHGSNIPFPEILSTLKTEVDKNNLYRKLLNRNYKINVMEHAECNCIRNIPENYITHCCTEDKKLTKEKEQKIFASSIMYINSTPCLHCAIQIVKSGIKHVAIVGHEPDFKNESWGMLWEDALDYLDMYGVEVIFYDMSGRAISRVEEGTIIACK